MKVGINLRYLHKQTSGIERALLEEIIALDLLEGDFSLFGYITERDFVDPNIEASLGKCNKLIIKKSKLPHENIITRLFWDMVHLGRIASNDNIDVFWGPSFSVPVTVKCPSIVTIHDLSYEYLPKAFTPAMRLWTKVIPKIAAKKASRVLTLSENSKKDIINFMKVDPERIDVVPLACSANFQYFPERKGQFQKILRRHGINSPYILTVSQISPRKNLEVLIKAFGLLKKDPNFLHKLVIVGNNAWMYESVYETVRKEGLIGEVIFIGYIQDSELVAFYNTADLFAFPSLYEGFGLPVLEAMSCGLPVICSNTSSLPEVVGNAGILVPPGDINAFSTAISDLLENPILTNELRTRGLQKAKEYSWEATARQLLGIFSSLCKDKREKL